MQHTDAPLIWEAELKFLSARYLQTWTMAMGATAVLMTMILGTIFAAEGAWDALPMMLLMIGWVVAGLWAFGLAVMALLLRGRVRVRYRVDDRGVRMQTIDRVVSGAARAATVIGALSGKPGLAGVGLIAQSRETEAVGWRGGFQAVADPAQRHITLRNRWRPLLYVQCTPENYAAVEARIAREMQQHGTTTRVSRHSPLPWYLGQSLLLLLACVPLLMLVDSHDIHLLPPILVMCFALATLWLINLFGWVVLAGLMLITGNVLFELFTPRDSYVHRGQTFTAVELAGAEDWAALGLAALGAAWLVRLSIRALRGRFLALLIRDADEADGG
ncbi:MAG: hypothetical protein MUE46_13810 [Xanthomonadales bacterium]|jgi:hypothetical protein|nr:hypothetical protein [Xanthomonadales bacterium]